MKYYYDIYLNFYDYPINYYEWDIGDKIEKILKIPIIRVNEIEEFISHISNIDINYEQFILSDCVNSVAIELVNQKSIYLSYLPYRDEEYVNRLASTIDISKIKYNHISNRDIPLNLREDNKIKTIIKEYLNQASNEELEYLYLDLTNKKSNNIKKIKEHLSKSIENNIDTYFYHLYKKICKNFQ